jgi:hypothetical protein
MITIVHDGSLASASAKTGAGFIDSNLRRCDSR